MIAQSTLLEETKCSDVHSFLSLDQTVLLFISLLKHINYVKSSFFRLGSKWQCPEFVKFLWGLNKLIKVSKINEKMTQLLLVYLYAGMQEALHIN